MINYISHGVLSLPNRVILNLNMGAYSHG